jgi:hypothetical protein
MIKIDATLLIQIQLALIGIVVILGMFYLWRTILRLESRLEKSLAKLAVGIKQSVVHENTAPQFPFVIPPQFQQDVNVPSVEDLTNAQELMQQVFGGGNVEQPQMMMFSMALNQELEEEPSNACIVEEIEGDSEEVTSTEQKLSSATLKEKTLVVDDDDDDDDAVSTSTDTNPISKSKLSQMKIEKLRELCKARELPTEGQKPQLIDRLLGLSRE